MTCACDALRKCTEQCGPSVKNSTTIPHPQMGKCILSEESFNPFLLFHSFEYFGPLLAVIIQSTVFRSIPGHIFLLFFRSSTSLSSRSPRIVDPPLSACLSLKLSVIFSLSKATGFLSHSGRNISLRLALLLPFKSPIASRIDISGYLQRYPTHRSRSHSHSIYRVHPPLQASPAHGSTFSSLSWISLCFSFTRKSASPRKKLGRRFFREESLGRTSRCLGMYLTSNVRQTSRILHKVKQKINTKTSWMDGWTNRSHGAGILTLAALFALCTAGCSCVWLLGAEIRCRLDGRNAAAVL